MPTHQDRATGTQLGRTCRPNSDAPREGGLLGRGPLPGAQTLYAGLAYFFVVRDGRYALAFWAALLWPIMLPLLVRALVREEAAGPTSTARERIPERVRHEVWRRDQGRCAVCGSRERLEFDHIVPVSRGGSHTARNLELLCERCNRQKGARI
jgi:hypothetical protein